MKPTSIEAEEAVKVAKQYALGLSTMNLDLIVPVLDTEFKYVYKIGYRGHGISTDVRYIGHLYKVFSFMKNTGLSIKTDYCCLEYKGVKFLSIKLLPPHFKSFVHPMEYQLNENLRAILPEQAVYLLPRVKNGLLCKIECYTASELYYYRIELLENEIIL
jgi:hypothetical protein